MLSRTAVDRIILLSFAVCFSVITISCFAESDDVVISGESANGTNSSDYFIVESGNDLTIDALSGVDFIEAAIGGGGSADLSYSSGTDTFTINGDLLTVTGSFTSFEDIKLQFDESDSDVVISGRSWRVLNIDGGLGSDKITTPHTGVVGGRVFLNELEDGVFKINASNGHLADFTISNFEVLSTTNGESNLYVSSNSLVKFEEISGGADSTLDTLYVQRGADAVFIWDEGDDWYFGVLGSSEVTKITNFEWLDINADTIYTENKELFSTEFSGRTLYGIDTIQFYSNTSDVQAIDGLNREVFSDITSENLASLEVERPVLGSGDNIVISGESANGTNSSDYFIVESGNDLTIDALSGVDFIEAAIGGGGSADLSYSSGTDTFTINGDLLTVTGSFTSFEDIKLQFDESDSDVVISGRSWRVLNIDGGLGSDKITTPHTGVVGGRVFLNELEDGVFKINASNGHLADFTISNFEVLSTTNGESNLYVSSNSLVKFEEISGGADSTLDTLYVQRGADAVFIWDEGDDWYFGVLGSSEVTKITNFEWLDINADTIYTENKELFSTEFSGRTLYGIDTIQFYSNTSDVQAIDGLNREVFSDITSENLASLEVERPVLGSGDNIVISGESANGTNSSDYFIVESGNDLTIDALSGVDFIEAAIGGGGSADLSYSSGTDTFTINGDLLTVTGSFTSFEDIKLQFDESDSDVVISGRSWRVLNIDGGLGSDKITTPRTGVVGGRVFLNELEDGVFKINASNGHLADFTISNFEVLSTTNGESNLYVSSNSLVKFEEISGGADSTLDTLYVQRGADAVFIWDEGDDWYFGVLGSSEVTKITNFEWLDINADTIYTENKELFSTEFSGRTLYGIDTIQFYSNTSDVQAIDGLGRAIVESGDLDSDGVADAADAFPFDFEENLDTDSDGVGNNADTDDDGDGIPDELDDFPLDANDFKDTDSDGIGDSVDPDDDDDGLLDEADPCPLVDGRYAPVGESGTSPDIQRFEFCIGEGEAGPVLELFVELSDAFSETLQASFLYWYIDNKQTWIQVSRDDGSLPLRASSALHPEAASGAYAIRIFAIKDNDGLELKLNEGQLNDLGFSTQTSVDNPRADNTTPLIAGFSSEGWTFDSEGVPQLRATVSVKEEESGLVQNSLILELLSPTGSSLQTRADSVENNIASFTLSLSKYAATGDYSVNTVRFSDFAGNNQLSQAWLQENPQVFKLENPLGDQDAPDLLAFVLSATFDNSSNRPVIQITGTAYDPVSKVDGVYLRLNRPSGGILDKWVKERANAETLIFSNQIPLTTEFEPGTYEVGYLRLNDFAENSIHFYKADVQDLGSNFSTGLNVYFPKAEEISTGETRVVASSKSDFVFGANGSDDVVEAGDGDDEIYTGSGDDDVDAGPGDDKIIGGAGEGDDRYDGGVGKDRIVYSSSALGIVVDMENGIASGSEIGSDILISIEEVVGGAGNDAFTLNNVSNTVFGAGGDDKFFNLEMNGFDSAFGGDGADSFYWAGQGTFVIAGDEGADTYYPEQLVEQGKVVIEDFDAEEGDKLVLASLLPTLGKAWSDLESGLITISEVFTLEQNNKVHSLILSEAYQDGSGKLLVAEIHGLNELADLAEIVDADGDGIIDSLDNCGLISNAKQMNFDLDSRGDACDLDDDNDGFTDEEELAEGTNPLNRFSCSAGCFSFDVDESTEVQPLSDGLLVIRHLFGFSGEPLISGAISGEANRSASEAISSYLTDADSELDIDGDGESKPLTDGLLLMRYLFGISGDALTTNAIGDSAERNTPEQIESYIRERVISE